MKKTMLLGSFLAATCLLSACVADGAGSDEDQVLDDQAATEGDLASTNASTCSQQSGTNMSGTDAALNALRRAKAGARLTGQEVSPEEIKGLFWFPLYSGAAKCAAALAELKPHMADDAQIFQGVGGIATKQQYFAEAASGAFLAPGRSGALLGTNYEDTRIAEFTSNGKRFILLEGISDFSLPLFGLQGVPLRFLSVWERNRDRTWALKFHLSTIEDKAGLQPSIDRVGTALAGGSATGVTLSAPLVSFNQAGVTHKVQSAAVTQTNGTIVDVLVHSANGAVLNADARTRQ
jgi:hypothetical protein